MPFKPPNSKINYVSARILYFNSDFNLLKYNAWNKN